MAFRIGGGLPIFSPIKIPSRLPHDGLLARHSRFKLLPNSWIPTQACRTRKSTEPCPPRRQTAFVSPLLLLRRFRSPPLAPRFLLLVRRKSLSRILLLLLVFRFFLLCIKCVNWRNVDVFCLNFSRVFIFFFFFYLTKIKTLWCVKVTNIKKLDRLRYNNFNYRCLKNWLTFSHIILLHSYQKFLPRSYN